jgi:hypothetical protein
MLGFFPMRKESVEEILHSQNEADQCQALPCQQPIYIQFNVFDCGCSSVFKKYGISIGLEIPYFIVILLIQLVIDRNKFSFHFAQRLSFWFDGAKLLSSLS